MNNQLATHFRTYFQMDAADASALAGAFGLMNLFARSLGGISSDILFEAVFLFCMVDSSQPWYVALAVLICFSLFVQMAEGTSYGIVPFMNKQQLAVVSALVGAGGNLGAVIAGFLLLQTHQRSAASFPGPCRTCHVLGFAVTLLLLAGAWGHVPWPSCG